MDKGMIILQDSLWNLRELINNLSTLRRKSIIPFAQHFKYALIDKNTRQKMRSIIAQTKKREKDDDGSVKH